MHRKNAYNFPDCASRNPKTSIRLGTECKASWFRQWSTDWSSSWQTATTLLKPLQNIIFSRAIKTVFIFTTTHKLICLPRSLTRMGWRIATRKTNSFSGIYELICRLRLLPIGWRRRRRMDDSWFTRRESQKTPNVMLAAELTDGSDSGRKVRLPGVGIEW